MKSGNGLDPGFETVHPSIEGPGLGRDDDEHPGNDLESIRIFAIERYAHRFAMQPHGVRYRENAPDFLRADPITCLHATFVAEDARRSPRMALEHPPPEARLPHAHVAPANAGLGNFRSAA